MADNLDRKRPNYYTWRNFIARESLAEKEMGFKADNNPQKIPRGVTRVYQDQNFIQTFQPLKTFNPSTLREIISIVMKAYEGGFKVKAVGSGHSFSDIMTIP